MTRKLVTRSHAPTRGDNRQWKNMRMPTREALFDVMVSSNV